MMMSVAAVTAAPVRSTAVWPCRSTRRPSSGEANAPQIAEALTARPAMAKEPVTRWTWTRIAMLSIAKGNRATIELARSARPSGPARRGEVRRMVMPGNVRPDRAGDKSHF